MRALSAVGIVVVLLAGCTTPARVSPSPETAAPPTATSPPEDAGVAYGVGAAAVNVLYVPGKAIVCSLGGVAAFGVLFLTFGGAYRPAAAVTRQACGGKWTVSAADLRPEGRSGDRESPGPID
jgi:hypothetical protein